MYRRDHVARDPYKGYQWLCKCKTPYPENEINDQARAPDHFHTKDEWKCSKCNKDRPNWKPSVQGKYANPPMWVTLELKAQYVEEFGHATYLCQEFGYDEFEDSEKFEEISTYNEKGSIGNLGEGIEMEEEIPIEELFYRDYDEDIPEDGEMDQQPMSQLSEATSSEPIMSQHSTASSDWTPIEKLTRDKGDDLIDSEDEMEGPGKAKKQKKDASPTAMEEAQEPPAEEVQEPPAEEVQEPPADVQPAPVVEAQSYPKVQLDNDMQGEARQLLLALNKFHKRVETDRSCSVPECTFEGTTAICLDFVQILCEKHHKDCCTGQNTEKHFLELTKGGKTKGMSNEERNIFWKQNIEELTVKMRGWIVCPENPLKLYCIQCAQSTKYVKTYPKTKLLQQDRAEMKRHLAKRVHFSLPNSTLE